MQQKYNIKTTQDKNFNVFTSAIAWAFLFWTVQPISSFGQLKYSLSDTIALPPAVRFGILENGFTYYILRNTSSDRRIEMTLIEKAGTCHIEKPNQIGIAHFVEHLFLRSTVNFPEGIKNFLDKSGLKFGMDFNASTGANTNYDLSIPSGDSILLKRSLLVLHDCAKGRLFLPKDVEQERSAVLRELSTGNNKSFFSLKEAIYLSLDKNTLYRPNILSEINNIDTVSAQTLRQFDERWYTPDQQAVIIVGDIEEKEIEQLVRTLFSTLKDKKDNDDRPTDFFKQYDVPLTNKDKLLVVNNGTQNQNIRIEIRKKRKSITNRGGGPATMGEVRQEIMDDLYNELAKQRLKRLPSGNDAKFGKLIYQVTRHAFDALAGIDALEFFLSVDDIVHVEDGIRYALTELRRIERWGFNAEEFFLAKNALQQAYSKKTNALNSRSLKQNLGSHFTTGSALLENETELYTSLLDDISVAELNAVFSDWLKDKENTDFLLLVPDDKNPLLPSQENILRLYNEVRNSDIERFKLKKIAELPKLPKRKECNDFVQSKLKSTDAVMLKLANGVRVILKSIRPLNTQVPIAVTLQGFNSKMPIKEVLRNTISPASSKLIEFIGAGHLNNIELSDWQTERRKMGYLDGGLYVNDQGVGIIGGNSSVDNYEALLQLVYWNFAKSQVNRKELFASLKTNIDKKFFKKSPEEKMNDTIASIIGGHNSFLINSLIDSIQLEKAIILHKEQFLNARDFTFVITGNFDVDSIKEITARYLGALTNVSEPNSTTNLTSDKPLSNPIKRYVNSSSTMIDDNTGNVKIRMIFPVYGPFKIHDRLSLQVINRILSPMLVTRLREKENGVYSVTSSFSNDDETQTCFFDIAFESAPEDVDRLIKATSEEVSNLSKCGISETGFYDKVDVIRKEIKDNLFSFKYWSDYLVAQLRKGEITAEILHREEILNKITPVTIQETARRFLYPNHFMLFKLL